MLYSVVPRQCKTPSEGVNAVKTASKSRGGIFRKKPPVYKIATQTAKQAQSAEDRKYAQHLYGEMTKKVFFKWMNWCFWAAFGVSCALYGNTGDLLMIEHDHATRFIAPVVTVVISNALIAGGIWMHMQRGLLDMHDYRIRRLAEALKWATVTVVVLAVGGLAFWWSKYQYFHPNKPALHVMWLVMAALLTLNSRIVVKVMLNHLLPEMRKKSKKDAAAAEAAEDEF